MDNTNKNKLFEHYLKLKFVKKNKQLENNIDDLTVRIELLEEQILKLETNIDNINTVLIEEQANNIKLLNRVNELENRENIHNNSQNKFYNFETKPFMLKPIHSDIDDYIDNLN